MDPWPHQSLEVFYPELHSLTATSPLKMVGFQVRNLQISSGQFSGAFAVSFREAICFSIRVPGNLAGTSTMKGSFFKFFK